MDNTKKPVGDKYIILDAKTKEEKKGKYFCLRLDSDDKKEVLAVQSALFAYIDEQRKLGNSDYANQVRDWAFGRRVVPSKESK